MSLRTRILLLVLLATLAPAVVLGLYFIEQRDRGISEAKDTLNALAKYAAENLDDKVKGTLQLLYGLSRAPDLSSPDKTACSEFLAGVLGRYPQYTGLLTITPDGDLHCDSLRSGRNLNVSGRDYFRQVRATLEPAFDVVIGGITGIAVLQVAYPVLDGQGALKYVLLGSLNLSQYAQGFVTAGHYSDFRILIWNRYGVLMVRKPDTGVANLAGKEFAASELFRFAASGAAGTVAELPDINGVPRVWALGVLPEPRGGGARITLGITRDALAAEANKDLRGALTVVMVVALLAFLGAWFVAEIGIRRQVRRISNVAGRVGMGELSARIGAPYPRGELGELMAIVDRTAGAVQAQQAEIESRSRDLQHVNRTLRVLSGINTLIVHVRKRQELFQKSCRVIVEDGQFPFAWIGDLNPATQDVTPVAWAGEDAEELTRAKSSARDDSPLGIGTVGQAIRGRRPVFNNDIVAHGFGGPRLKEILRLGYRSQITLPLFLDQTVMGTLTIYAREPNFFDEEELKLLTELAGDISFAIDHIEKQERLEYLAYYDALTGLANRSLFLERVAQYLRSAASGGYKLAVLLTDLERFKNINDSLGRPAGDVLLKQVAEWLTRNAGDANLVARLGADHFAMVLPEVKQDGDVGRMLENMMAAFLGHPFRLNDAVFRINAKVGAALFPDDGADADTLFRNAEAALKKAKASGERYLFYRQEMTEKVAGKLTLENQLRQALDNEEFVLHYQPKGNLASGTLSGAEALIRWNDPRTGLVPPGSFITILEETGLIFEVGRWALRKAIADYLRWHAAGLPTVRIAVNVSPLQLRNRGFIDEIEQVISVDANAPAGLELEITESLIMEDVKHSIASLQAIRAMGVTIAIDDFGTGFSSLSYLAKLPVDTLKIDRSFVIQMTTGPEGLALISTIINLAHSLKLKVVAEGVETEEQLRLLRLLSCDEMQGFLFSKAVPAEIFGAKFLTLPPTA